MTVAPIIDSSWLRLPDDSFGAGPSTLTPLDHSSTFDQDEESGSEWSFSDEEELITLDLGTDRIARRSLLGYSAGLDTDFTTEVNPSGSSSRTIRSSRGLASATAEKTSDGAERNKPGTHLGAGKMLSLTGLDTLSPLLKINDTILRGRNMTMFGSEIVLQDQFDPTRSRGKQHRLQPVPPTTGPSTRANAQSSTTRKKILFRPIYDPKSRETEDGNANIAALKKLAAPRTEIMGMGIDAGRMTVGDLAGQTGELVEGEGSKVGRGKYKRKEVSESEAMIRAAERKVRRAAKEHAKQKEQEEAAQQQAEGSGAHQEEQSPPRS